MTFSLNLDAMFQRKQEEAEASRGEFQRIIQRLQDDPGYAKAIAPFVGEEINLSDAEGIRKFNALIAAHGDRARYAEAEAEAMYSDIDAILDGNVERIAATIAPRTDGQHLIYAGKVNTLFGDPEAGKSLVGTAIAVTVLRDGGSVLWIDLDHNGAAETVSRFVDFGAPLETLRSRETFRFLDNPDDPEALLRAVEDAQTWRPTLVVVDSLGELIPLFGGNSDNADDFTRINRQVNAAFADTGAAVIAIDHMAKGEGSRSYGAGGTMAKKRAANGAYYLVENVTSFAPGKGGKSRLRIVKDRPGDIRANSPRGTGKPEAATFDLAPDGAFRFWSPTHVDKTTQEDAEDPRFAILETMDKLTVTAVKARFSIGTNGARDLLDAYKERRPF